MRTTITLLLISIIFRFTSYGQDSPKLKLTGTNPSITRGNIDTEILSAIIQEKQEEIKKRVFRNTIVRQFKKEENDYTKKLNNFATFNYIYNLMDILTSGKNKTVMTRTAIENTAEFAFVFGLAYFTKPEIVIKAKADYGNKDLTSEVNTIKVKNPTEVRKFNTLIDLCYLVVIENEEKFQEQFKFKNSLVNESFEKWLKADNVYLQELKAAKGPEKQELEDLKEEVTENMEKILLVVNQTKELLEIGREINDSGLNTQIEELLTRLGDANGSEISTELDSFRNSNSDLLSDTHEEYLEKLSGFVASDWDHYKNLFNFYKDLEKSDFKNFTMTENQYYGMKFLIKGFIDVAKHQYPNDAVATVLDFFNENTLVQFGELETNTTVENGYLYVDMESLISAIDQHFNSITKRKITVYVTPFLSLGANYASFKEDNNLLNNGLNGSNSIGDLYFASEKIGIKWKLWNWKYTHAFEAGESVKYYGREFYWLRPQEEPLISDIYLFGYGSGLLYNLVDLKTEENFDYGLVGGGIGITFFNGLSANLSVASPIVNKSISSKNSFFNFGFDIPIIEYISALSDKD